LPSAYRHSLATVIAAFLLAGATGRLCAQSPESAQAKAERGDWVAAEQEWRQLAEASPKDYRYWTSLGIAQAHQDKLQDAIESYQRARKLAPQDGQTNFNFGLAYFKLGKLDQAIPRFRAATASLPQVPQGHLLLGMSLWGTHDYAAAIQPLEEAKQLGLRNGELDMVLAQCYIRTRQTEKAKAQLEAMLRDDPNSGGVHFLLGEAEDVAGHTDKAIAEFQEALVKQPNIPNAHFALGYLYWKSKDWEQAEQAFREELRREPNHAESLIYLGDSLLKTDRKAEAKTVLDRPVEASASSWLLELDRGILTADNDKSAALAHLEASVRLAPKRNEARYRLAQLYRALGNLPAAAEQLKIVSQLHKQEEDDLINKVSSPAY
jgi:tetratricopeptide (TPR) repeat protein